MLREGLKGDQSVGIFNAGYGLNFFTNKMTDIGDQWRYFALVGSRICKGRASKDETYPALANILRDCAHREKELYRELLMIVR